MITPEIITEVENGNLETLIKLDQNGLFLAPHENLADFAQRLKNLQNRLDDFQKKITNDGFYEIENLKFQGKNLIPQIDFMIAQELTKKFYHFEIDWVGGFYQNPSFSWLFGGCCYTSTPDFFAIFQIKEKLKNTNKKQFYSREEIISHELCHVARSGIKNGHKFEEFFAYQTSQKKMRKIVGTVLYSSFDTFLILFLAFSLPFFQYLKNTFNLANWLSLLPFLLILCSVLFYFLRYKKIKKTYNSAIKNLEKFFGENSTAVLFRCDDAEIREISQIDFIEKFLANQKQNLRWQIFQENLKK